MKTWITVLVLFVAIILLVGCEKGTVAKKSSPPPPFGTEVLPNVFDDGQSSVYIKVDNPMGWVEDAAVADIVTKKMKWGQQFPNKRVITMSIVTGVDESYSVSMAIGLLIHYEQR